MDISKGESKKTYTLNLGQTGYGPKGEHSLSDWRAECLSNLILGSEAFKAWQDSWSGATSNDLKDVAFDTATGLEKFREGYAARKLKPFTLDFSNCVFDENQDFSGYIFKHTTLFTKSTIKNGNFKKCNFYEYVDFNESLFGNCANFEKAEFKSVSFTKTNFRCNYVSFKNVIFDTHVTFDAVQFPGQPTSSNGVHFNNAHFNSGVEFRDCSITCLSNFNDVNIYHGVRFKNVIFKENCNFNRVKFFPKWGNTARTRHTGLGADFSKTVFESDVDFSGCVFDIPAYFIETQFNGDVAFDYAQFNCDVRFFNTKFEGGSFFNDTKFTGDGAKRLGQMKRMAEENGHTDQALNFNALELNAKRGQVKIKIKTFNWLQKLGDSDFWFANATALYDKLSDYGRSFTRPLIAYLVLLLFTFWLGLANAIIFSAKGCENETWYLFSNLNREQIECSASKPKEGEKPFKLTAWRASSEYTLYRAAGVLDFSDSDKQTKEVARRLFDQEIEPWWMRIWGVFKAIASTALLFLVALGLRNKYRIK